MELALYKCFCVKANICKCFCVKATICKCFCVKANILSNLRDLMFSSFGYILLMLLLDESWYVY